MTHFKKIECDCGQGHTVGGGDTTCSCGQMYNAFGQAVTCSLGNIDPADAGEYYEHDY